MMQQDLIPVGIWVRLHLPDFKPVIAFTYLDSQAGFSARGGEEGDPDPGRSIAVTVRLSSEICPWEALGEEEKQNLGLPDVPEWMQHYGPQPPKGMLWGHWRDHPALQGRFHPEFYDDLQVYVHDGGPRLTMLSPEFVWVRVTGVEDGPMGDVFCGTVLNQPHMLQTVAQYQPILFVVPAGFAHPIMMTEKYLAERAQWRILSCPHCNLSEMLDVPSDFQAKVFPHVPKAGGDIESAVMTMFGMFCPACGGVMVASLRENPDDPYVETPSEKGEPRVPFAVPYHLRTQAPVKPPARKWWQFWS